MNNRERVAQHISQVAELILRRELLHNRSRLFVVLIAQIAKQVGERTERMPQQVSWEEWWKDTGQPTPSPDQPALAYYFYQGRNFEVKIYACWNMPVSEWEDIHSFVREMEPDNIFWQGDRRYTYWGYAAYTFLPVNEREVFFSLEIDLAQNGKAFDGPFSHATPHHEQDIRYSLGKMGLNYQYKQRQFGLDIVRFPFKRVFKGTFLTWEGYEMRWDTVPRITAHRPAL